MQALNDSGAPRDHWMPLNISAKNAHVHFSGGHSICPAAGSFGSDAAALAIQETTRSRTPPVAMTRTLSPPSLALLPRSHRRRERQADIRQGRERMSDEQRDLPEELPHRRPRAQRARQQLLEIHKRQDQQRQRQQVSDVAEEVLPI
jgi:hypothetical protein